VNSLEATEDYTRLAANVCVCSTRRHDDMFDSDITRHSRRCETVKAQLCEWKHRADAMK